MNIRHLDLNLLAAFEALLIERNVTRASRRMGVTQPAMSNALSRLRVLMNDPLFVRAPGGMSPTPRAIAMGPTVRTALDSLRSTIGAVRFDPLQSEARFNLGALDHVELLYGPSIAGRLGEAGPRTSLRIRRLDGIFELPLAQLEAGMMDCALGFFPQPLPPKLPLQSQVLLQDDWVCIVRRNHPQGGGRLTIEDYAALKHVAINVGANDGVGLIDRVLAERGLTRRCPVCLPHFSSVPLHVAQTDYVATLPRRLADLFAATLALEVFDAPLPLPPISLSLIWHARSAEDEAHRWFRTLVADAVS